MTSLIKVHSDLIGNRYRSMKSPIGIGTRSSGFLFTGESIQSLRLAVNGIHGLCMWRDLLNTTTTSPPTGH